jgi:hypothetical protein
LTEYAKAINPDEENPENMPFATFYGDCNTCQVIGQYSYLDQVDHAKRMKEVGIWCLSFGVCVYVALSIWWWISETLGKIYRLNDDSSAPSIDEQGDED